MTVFDGIPFLEDAQDWFEDFYSETVGGIHYVIDTLDRVFEDMGETVAGAVGDIWERVWEPIWETYSEAIHLTYEWTRNIPQPWHSFMRIFLIGPALAVTSLKPSLDHVANLVWSLVPDWLKTGVDKVADWVEEKAGKVYEWVEDLPDKLTGLKEDITNTLVPEFRSGVNDILGGVADWISQLLKGINEMVTGTAEKIWGEAKEHWTLLLGPVGGFYDWYKTHNIGNKELWDQIRDWLLKLGTHVAGGAREVLDGVWDTVNDLFEWILSKLQGAFDKLAELTMPQEMKITGPVDAWKQALGMVSRVMVMAIPFAVATIAGELVHPLKELGFGQASALLWEASNFKVIGEDLLKTITYALMTLPLRYALFYWSTPRIPEEEMIFPLIERGVLDKDTFIDVFKKMGYSDYWGRLYWDTHWQEPQLFDLVKMYWRGLINDEEFKKWLKYIGYEPSLWDKYLELTRNIPPANDLINFVVKEAFPLENLPPAPSEFEKYMKMQGYSEEWARAYWFVHWRMPSFEQLQEAYFRGIISLEEFEKYIVWWDYAPFQRPGISKSDMEIMKELIYRMPDKLDIRFMLRWGIISTEEAAQLFKMTGIHPDWVNKVAEANFMNLFQDERTQLRNAILSMYRDGYLTEEEARKALIDARFTKEETEILLKAYRMNKEKDLNDLLLNYYKQLFKKGLISKSQFVGDLVEQGWDEALIRRLADLLEVMYQKVERPDETKDDRNRVRTQLVNLYKEGYITEDELRSELEGLQFSPDEIELTIKEANLRYQYDYYSDVVKVLKTAYKKGTMTAEDVKEELSKIIKIPERVNALVALWNLEMMPKPKLSTTSS